MKAICINLPHRTDRRQESEKEFAKLPFHVEFYEPVPHETPYLSFNHTMHKILSEITDFTFVFEDDVHFINTDIEPVILKAPVDFDLLYLGGNVREPLKKMNNHWWRVQNTWTTHAILYTSKGAKKILEVFDKDGLIYDEQLRTKVQPVLNCYICKPFLAIQRPSHSDIWGIHADYGILNTQNNLI